MYDTADTVCKFYNQTGTVYIFIQVKKGRENRIRINTGTKIQKSFWDVKKGRCKNQYSFANKTNSDLKAIEVKANEVFNMLVSKYSNMDNVSFEILKSEFLKLYSNELKNEQNLFFNCYDTFLDSVKNKVTSATYWEFTNTKSKLINFQSVSNYKLSFESINNNFKIEFEKYLYQFNYNNNYIAKIYSKLKQFLNYCYINNYHTNIYYKQLNFSTYKKDIITLTTTEINSIKELTNLTPEQSEVKDLFLLQIEILQRYSDLINITPTAIFKDSENDLILKIRQKKTNTIVEIPLSKTAIQILSKYNYQLPKLKNQKYNQLLKQICEIAKIDNMINITSYRNGKRIIENVPKYNCITSHTARRTGATLLVGKNVPINYVMQLTGHLTIAQFQKYIGKTETKQLKNILKNYWSNENE